MSKVSTNSTTNFTLHEALAHMVQPTHGRTARTVEYWATQIGISASLLYAMCNGDRPITLKVAIDITNATGDTLLMQAMARETHGFFLPKPQMEIPASGQTLAQVADATVQCAEAIRAMGKAIEDGVVDEQERKHISREVLECAASIACAERLVMSMPSKANVKEFKRTVM